MCALVPRSPTAIESSDRGHQFPLCICHGHRDAERDYFVENLFEKLVSKFFFPSCPCVLDLACCKQSMGKLCFTQLFSTVICSNFLKGVCLTLTLFFIAILAKPSPDRLLL